MPAPLLVSNLVNIQYLTGLRMTAGVMLITNSRKMLFVDDRYIEKAKKESPRSVKVLHVKDLEKEVKRLKRVLFEANDLSYARYDRWKKLFRGTKLIPSMNVIEEMRRKKKKEEITATQKACRITDSILKQIPRSIRVGISEADLARKIEEMALNLGAEEMAFETIVAFGTHTSRPHHRPTKKKFRKGDLVQIDMGVKVKGYCSDCSRIFFTKKPTEEQKKIFDLLVKLVQETTKMAKPGTLNTALDRYARTAIKKAGYGELFLHSLGHGVGLEVHEGVNLSSRAKGKMKKSILLHEVLTTEPGIYFAGKWGMRIEDTFLVTRSGGKSLTKARY